ncbi:hypothetical protein OS493_004191 [Desmophyllum pertusum]|uniref:nitric-oxide synthase (NADPH) n=1 Tax=Desmophyllum pertusum TaxID=174260 RepID=A0A9W9ZWC7_9CNID|nr:hypothetical protein OS493_004191 [Desmophyllum pertusum]
MGTPESVHRHRNLSSVSHERVGRKTANCNASGDQVNAFISNISRAVKFSAKLFSKALAKRQKAVILYATETGKSERYAKMLGELFSHAFDPKDCPASEEYAHPEMENEQLVLNCEPAHLVNGDLTLSLIIAQYDETYSRQPVWFTKEKEKSGIDLTEQQVSHYANLRLRCDSFCISEEIKQSCSGNQSLDTVPQEWLGTRPPFRLALMCDICLRAATLLSVKNLQAAESSRSTISVQCKTENNTELQYKAGDHVAIFPANRPELVQALIDRLLDGVDPDKPIVVEALREVKGLLGTTKKWEAFRRLPSPITVRKALSRYLDITSVPSPQILKFLAAMAADEAEKEKTGSSWPGEGNNRYEDWKFESECNILDVLQEFPSLQVPADLLLTAASLVAADLFPGEVHLTVAVVQFNKKGEEFTLYKRSIVPVIRISLV